MKKRCLILLSALILVSCKAAFAQVPVISQPVNISISTVLDLQFVSGQTLTSNFKFNSTSLLDNGIAVASATTLTYSSNQAWYVSIAAGAAFFSSGTSPNALPASVIQYRLHGNTTYTPLSTTAASLSGTSASKITRGTGNIAVDYFLNPGYAYPPAADYTISIVYTISNQ